MGEARSRRKGEGRREEGGARRLRDRASQGNDRGMRWNPGALALAALTMGLPTMARAEAYRFLKGPYLQGLGTTGVSVRWEGSEAVGGVVEVTGPDGKPQRVTTEEKGAFHALTVGELKPGTSYTYRVKVGDVTSAEGRFTTAPGENKPFSFLLYGDNRSDHDAHASVVKAMQAVPSDFLLNTGDLVAEGDSARDWEAFFHVETPMLKDRCLFACIGNHEMTGNNANNYLRYFQTGKDAAGARSLFFSVRWSSARFFFLNAFVPWSSGPDRAWIEQELARSDGEEGLLHRFVVLHQGVGSSGPHGPNKEMLGAGVIDLFRKHKVTAVFAGHDHLYERGELKGLKYLLSGGGGAPLYKARKRPDPATQAVEAVHHFVEVQVDGATVLLTARRVDGSTLEKCEARPEGWVCSVKLPPPPPPEPPRPPPPPSVPEKKGACDCATPRIDENPPWGLLLLALGLLRRSPRRR